MLKHFNRSFEDTTHDAWTSHNLGNIIASPDPLNVQRQDSSSSSNDNEPCDEAILNRQSPLARYRHLKNDFAAGGFNLHYDRSWDDWMPCKLSDDSASLSSSTDETLKYPEPALLRPPLWRLRTSIVAIFAPLNDIPDLQSLEKGLLDNELNRVQICSGHRITTSEQIQTLLLSYPLPERHGPKMKADARNIYWAMYRRLWTGIVLINSVMIIAVASTPDVAIGSFTYQQASTAVAINFILAAFGRQEHVINLLFRLVCVLPFWTPLQIRRLLAHLYTYGGLHAGAGISAFLWYIYFIVLLVLQFQGTYLETAAVGPITGIILTILFLVLLLSFPCIKQRSRKIWELSHRYGGWSAISLSWVQTFLIDFSEAQHSNKPLWLKLVTSPSFWILSIITCCIVYPWLRLRRRKVEPEILSDEAVRLWFNDRKQTPCVGCQLSHAPLIQNHGYATIPNRDNQHGYSVLVRKAGAWSRNIVNHPPKHIWMRGAPTTSALRVATLFRPIVVVATGSLIGPCLSFLQARPDYPMRIIWSACAPQQTYGCAIMNAVLRADPHAMIIDTELPGCEQLDLLPLAYAMYLEAAADAVVIISQADVTRRLVTELEARRIAAFGPIYDS